MPKLRAEKLKDSGLGNHVGIHPSSRAQPPKKAKITIIEAIPGDLGPKVHLSPCGVGWKPA